MTLMPGPPATRVEPIPELSPFTPSLVERLRAIRTSSARRQDDVFMKVGDSSTVSRGFLECFGYPEEVDLDGRDELSDPDVKRVLADLRGHFGTKVAIRGSTNKGKIELEFYSQDDLNRLLKLLLET